MADADVGAESPNDSAGGDEESVELPSHATRLDWYNDWEEQQRKNRREARLDRDYYDGKQWTVKEMGALKERGQPATVNNRIAKKINTLLGEEIEKRFEPVGRPRKPGGTDDARVVTDALRYIADEQEFARVKSAVTRSFLIEGIGAALKRVADGKHELLHVEYDRFGYDPHSREVLFGDALYTFVISWLDFDEAEELFPGAKNMLETASGGSGAQYDDSAADSPRNWTSGRGDRKRVQVIEMYFKVGDDCYVSFFTKAGDLRDPEKTAYLDDDGKHTVCPLVACSCYIDAEGSRYGVVRNLRSPQDAINKRESKSLHLLNSQQIIAEQNTIPNPEEFKDEIAKPDGYAEVAAGGLASPDGPRVQINRHLDLASGHVQLLQEAKANIDGIGPSASQLPELPSSASGRAQQMRRKAAQLDYGTIFDHLRWWSKQVFELDWVCAKWGWSKEKWLRVTDDQELTGYRFVGLNRPTTIAERFGELLQHQPPVPPEKALQTAAGTYAPQILAMAQQQMQQLAQQAQAQQQPPPPPQTLVQIIQQNPLMNQVITVNEVAKMVVDIVLDEAPDTAVLADEQFATLTDMMPPIIQARPDMAPKMARMLVQASSLPDKRELIAAFDQQPDPQVAKLQAQNQQLQQRMAVLQAQLVAAEVQKTQADARLSDARAQQLGVAMTQPEQPEPMKPHEQMQLQRDQLGAQIDVAKAKAQIEKEQALTTKHHVDTQINIAKAQHGMMPQVPQGGLP